MKKVTVKDILTEHEKRIALDNITRYLAISEKMVVVTVSQVTPVETRVVTTCFGIKSQEELKGILAISGNTQLTPLDKSHDH